MKFKKKLTKVGNSYAVIVPMTFLDSGYIQTNKEYEWTFQEVQNADKSDALNND